MTGRIVVSALGGPEVLKWEDADAGEPGQGEARIRQTAVGLNFIDVYFRTGLYPGPPCPFVLGMEGAGVVEAVGPGVTTLTAGDRVAYGGGPIGAYAEARVVPADRLVKIPDFIDDATAAAAMLKGMTAEYLLCRTHPVKKGETILVHAAAGGVGLILCQWAKHLGATVIGTVGSEDKAELAKASGCDHPILYRREDVVARVKELTGGEGVPVVYDSVGKDTFDASLECLGPRGMLVLYGQSSGKVEPFDPGVLAARGSLFLTRPTLMTYTASRVELLGSAQRLFDVIGDGAVTIQIGQRFALRQAARAHRALEARETRGSTVLEV